SLGRRVTCSLGCHSWTMCSSEHRHSVFQVILWITAPPIKDDCHRILRRTVTMEHSPTPVFVATTERIETSGKNEAYTSSVSWPAVFAGAFVAAALSLILLALGAGAGLSSISPWSTIGASATTVGLIAIVWLIVTQVIASTMGGYLAGRLRTKCVNVHTDEVHFRDTAHGFLVWAVGLVITTAFLASAATSMLGGAAKTGTATDAQRLDPHEYFVDKLLRSDHPNPAPIDSSIRLEVGTIFANALRQSDVSGADKTYLGELVAARTGLSQSDAEKRVSD